MNQDHYIEACELTDRFSHDDSQVNALLDQIQDPIDHFSGDGAYDESPVYAAVTTHSPNADVAIPLDPLLLKKIKLPNFVTEIFVKLMNLAG